MTRNDVIVIVGLFTFLLFWVWVSTR